MPKDSTHASDDEAFDLGELAGRDLVHGVPKAPVVERLWVQVDEPVACGRRPPVAKAELGARGNDSVEDQERDVGPHRCRSIRASRPDHLIDDLGDTKTFDHRPGSCEVTKSEVPGPLGDRCRTCHCSLDVLGLSQVALPGHLRLAVHPGHLAQVVIGLPVDLLRDDGSHALGNTPSGDKSRAFDQDIRAGQEPFFEESLQEGRSRLIGIARKLPLGWWRR